VALNFPDNPTVGDIYTDNTSGFSYEWDGVVWKSYTPSATKNITILDDISGSFDGIQTIFSITVSAVSFTPANAQQLRIVLGGVVQEPGSDYTVSGTSLIFTTPPAGGLSFSGISLGPAVPVGVPGDGTVTPAKLSTGGPVWNSSGDVNISGITTINDKVKVGVGTTALIVEGDARITGILTIGTSSITLDGTNNTLKVGTGVTLSSDGINVGVVTATAFFGDGAGLTGVGAGLPQVLTFSPLDGQTGVSPATNIILTFNQGVAIGTGNVTLRDSSGIGTVLQTIGINSTSVSISGAQVIIDPPSFLPLNTDVYIGVDTGAIVNANGQDYVGLSTYNFTTADDLVVTYSPDNGSTGNSYESSIALTFPTPPKRGTGTVELRRGAVDGTLLESYDALTSNRISVSGNQWILDPTVIFLPDDVIYVIIPDTGITDYAGLNIGGITKSYSFTVQSVTYLSISPAIGSTNVGINTNIVLTFDNTPARGIGTISLRFDEAGGTIIESFDAASSDRISISTTSPYTYTIDPTNALPAGSLIYLVIPDTAIVGFAGVTIGGDTFPYSLTTQNRTLFSWGRNQYAQLGQDNTTQYSSPIQIPGNSWNSMSGNFGHSLATKDDGTLWVWGSNSNGELGQNNLTQYSSPVQIPGTQWSSVRAAYLYSLATKTDGTLWVWGRNQYAQLGQDNTTPYSSPIQIPGTSWSSISAGQYYSLATKTDGTLWAWGYNTSGQLGLGDRSQYYSPTQIPGTSWSSISGGSNHTLATKTNGTLWAWGYNFYGQLGQNDRISNSSPTQVPGTLWSSISGGSQYTLATKTDGTLWAWGYNDQGQLGRNTNATQYSSPVQIPGTSWSSISCGSNHTLATKDDGTLWAWGFNVYGTLGQDNTTPYSSPVQIPGTTWSSTSISSNAQHSLATQIS